MSRRDEAGAYKFQELADTEELLLGRRTHDGFAKAWPTMTDTGDVVDGLRKLVEGEGGTLLLSGSGELFNLCHQHDLIDEYRLMLFPYPLGADGTKPLFNGGPRRALRLVDTTRLPKGVVVQTYHRAASPAEPSRADEDYANMSSV